MTKCFKILIFAFVILLNLNVKANTDSDKIRFIKSSSFKSIQQIAQQRNQPIFIDFHAYWCIPCRNMEKDVFQNIKVAEFMNNNFVNYKVNIEQGNGPLLSIALGVEKLPGMVIINPNGDIIQIKDSAIGKDNFLRWAKKGLNYFKSNASKETIIAKESTQEINKYCIPYVEKKHFFFF